MKARTTPAAMSARWSLPLTFPSSEQHRPFLLKSIQPSALAPPGLFLQATVQMARHGPARAEHGLLARDHIVLNEDH